MYFCYLINNTLKAPSVTVKMASVTTRAPNQVNKKTSRYFKTSLFSHKAIVWETSGALCFVV